MIKEIQLLDVVEFLEILKEYNYTMIEKFARIDNEGSMINICGRFSIMNTKINKYIEHTYNLGNTEESVGEVLKLLDEMKTLLADTKDMNSNNILLDKVESCINDITSSKIK